MPLLEALALAAGVAVASGQPPATGAAAPGVATVVTFDNGEFDLPLFTPRWNGRWSQPSAAQEIATGIARITGAHPTVFTYLPPGRTPGRPGQPFAVEPRQPRCVGPARTPTDPCWCNPSDNCWDQLGANYHPDASTSLLLTASALREQLDGRGPRIEVHLADLFEEDPTAADHPGNSDRCVTVDGTRKAIEGLLRSPAGQSLDHLAVGVLRVTVDPPPQGGTYGWTYDLAQERDGRAAHPSRGAVAGAVAEASSAGCWSGRKGASWDASRGPYDLAMAVFVVGVDTRAHGAAWDAFLDGLQGQLASETMKFGLVRLREPPPPPGVLEGTIDVGELGAIRAPAASEPPRLPCDDVVVRTELAVGGTSIAPAAVGARCDGSAILELRAADVERAFLRAAGIDPTRDRATITGRITLESTEDAVRTAFAALTPLAAGGDRPLPLWDATGQALGLGADGRADRPWRPWRRDVEVRSLAVVGVDTRPWGAASTLAATTGLVVAIGVYLGLLKLQAERTLRVYWDRNVGPGKDPLRQRPLAAVLAEAQREVQRRWGQRVAVAGISALVAVAIAFWALMRLHLVRLG